MDASSAIRFFLVQSFFVITSLLNSYSWSNVHCTGAVRVPGTAWSEDDQWSSAPQPEPGLCWARQQVFKTCHLHQSRRLDMCFNRAWFELHRDVEDMIRAWQHQNNSKHWSEALGDVQFQKNTRLLFWTTFYCLWSCVSSTHNSTFSSLYKYCMQRSKE